MQLTLEPWIPKHEMMLIAGPCSAETPEQVMSVARALAQQPKVKLFRAGVWKPRTRPNNFEGHGETALPWLQAVKEETGLKVTVEVANAAQTEAALRYGVDVLWIGARTTVNPFAVQEVADALRGVDIPVMVKNPINPDLQLWLGALERLNVVGVKKLAAIHRGFSGMGKTAYRNPPLWQYPIELKRLVPELPIICDPSHIAGNRTLLYEIAARALELQMNGIMIETHPNPDQAWSDAAQQITPDALAAMQEKLALRTANFHDSNQLAKIRAYREQIDKLDADLLQLLAQRMAIVDEIGALKKDSNVAVYQVERWEEIVRDRLAQAVNLGLEAKFLQQILDTIHQYAIDRQVRITTFGTNAPNVET